jgi:uncharacterized protein YifE (UPF0438 family)
MLEKNLVIKKETIVNVNGRNVRFIEFESAREGDFVKVCTYDHHLGVASEYVWLKNKYCNAVRINQRLTTIRLNGNKIKCDILSIKTGNNEIKDIYFDISQMAENLSNITLGKTNKNMWEEKAKIIYEKLTQEYCFSVEEDDEESLFKKIDENVNIGFDITYFFGFIIKGNKTDKILREKLLKILCTYISSGFIGSIIITNRILGGNIKIDNLNDIRIVFENYKCLEEEAKKVIGVV